MGEEGVNEFHAFLVVVDQCSPVKGLRAGDGDGGIGGASCTYIQCHAANNCSVLGRQGEETLNRKGRRLLDLCAVDELVILNTFYQHEEIHKFT